jgi:hypothetical protein
LFAANAEMGDLMAKALYGAGDIVVLKDGPLRHARSTSEFRILAVMPESEGQVQYRARSDVEGFERRISASEIDVEKSVASRHMPPAPASKSAHEPWFKPAAIKTKK